MRWIEIEPGESADRSCACCGGVTRTVWGYAYADGGAYAVYYARWTRERPDHGFVMAVSIGGWGEGADLREKRLVALEGRFLDTGPGFCVLDAADSPWGGEPHLGRPLARADVIATPLAPEIFHLVDHIVADDPRVEEFIEKAIQNQGGP